MNRKIIPILIVCSIFLMGIIVVLDNHKKDNIYNYYKDANSFSHEISENDYLRVISELKMEREKQGFIEYNFKKDTSWEHQNN